MSLPYSDPSLPANPAPIFQDNSFVRGDHARANNQAIWGNLDYLEALTLARALLAGSASQDFSAKDLSTSSITNSGQISSATILNAGVNITKYFKGKVTALEYNTNALPPTIKAGTIDVKGVLVNYDADETLALTDALGGVSQSFSDHTYSWIFNIVGVDGVARWTPAMDVASPVLENANSTGVTIAGGTATIATTNALTGVSAGMEVVLMGADIAGVPLILTGKIVAATPSTSLTVKTFASGTVTGTITFSVYGRVVTKHGTGSDSVINDTTVGKYTPSPLYCKDLDGYYLDQYGRSTSVAANAVYKILGAGFIDGSGLMTHVIGYKSGSNKDDNIVESDSTATSGTATTAYGVAIARFTKLWGNDYTYTNADGRYTANRKLRASFGVISWLTVAGSAAGYNYLRIDGNLKSEHYQSVITNNSVNRIKLYLNSDLPKSSYLDIYAGVISTANQVYNIDAKFEVL